MTAILKTPRGRWRVRDASLRVDAEYATHGEAQAKANWCNGEKIKSMARPKRELCEDCGGTGEVEMMERVYPGEPHMAEVGSRPCHCQSKIEEYEHA